MNIWIILNSFGAIALFIFGMKLMSDGVQRASGRRLRRALNSMTRDRYRAFLSGLFLTSIIQSSSAVSLLTISFVNAGLLKLLRAFAIIIGANIGTTVTLWLVGIGLEISLYKICLPIVAIALPFYFSKNSKSRGWATFAIGFALIFVGLGLLQQNLANETSDPNFIHFLNGLQGSGYLDYLLFLGVGLIVTLIVQSSSASTAIIISLLSLNFPLELCAAMVIGANIGTTFTAQLAASIGNYYAKQVANFHTFFNLIGALLFFFIIPQVIELLQNLFPINEEYYVLAAFHTLFNVVTALVLFPLLTPITKSVLARVPNPKNQKEKLQMMNSLFSASPEMFVFEANKRLISFAGNTKQTIATLGRLITESDKEKFNELHKRILSLEDEGDTIEKDISQYLNSIYANDLMGDTSKRIHHLLNVAQQLENIGDLAIKTSYTHKYRRESNSFITPKLRTFLIEIQDTISVATTHLIQNLNEIDVDPELKLARKYENEINVLYDDALAALINTTNKGKISAISSIYYKELIQNYEIIGDHIFKANLALVK